MDLFAVWTCSGWGYSTTRGPDTSSQWKEFGWRKAGRTTEFNVPGGGGNRIYSGIWCSKTGSEFRKKTSFIVTQLCLKKNRNINPSLKHYRGSMYFLIPMYFIFSMYFIILMCFLISMYFLILMHFLISEFSNPYVFSNTYVFPNSLF